MCTWILTRLQFFTRSRTPCSCRNLFLDHSEAGGDGGAYGLPLHCLLQHSAEGVHGEAGAGPLGSQLLRPEGTYTENDAVLKLMNKKVPMLKKMF